MEANLENLPFFRFEGTGPIIRLAKGFSCLVNNPAALLSNQNTEPSLLVCFRLVFMISALKTSPFLTLELFLILFLSLDTATTITSPKNACFLLKPPSTFMQRTVLGTFCAAF